MKSLFAGLVLLCALHANAQGLPRPIYDGATQLVANVTEVTYLASASGGSLTPGKEWYGFRIVQLDNGTCQKIERTNFKIVEVGGVERPEFTEAKTPVECPFVKNESNPAAK